MESTQQRLNARYVPTFVGIRGVLIILLITILSPKIALPSDFTFSYSPDYYYGYIDVDNSTSDLTSRGTVSMGVPIVWTNDIVRHHTGIFAGLDTGNTNFLISENKHIDTRYNIMVGPSIGIYTNSQDFNLKVMSRQGISVERVDEDSDAESHRYYGYTAILGLHNWGIVYDHFVVGGENRLGYALFHRFNDNLEFMYRQEGDLHGNVYRSNMFMLNITY